METLPISAARDRLTQLVANIAHEPITIARYGQPAAVIVSPRFFERAVEALEDVEDLQAIEEARANPQPTVPWEQLVAELNLVRDQLPVKAIAHAHEALGLA
jgi:antitoxin Phd